jgi:exodeoxyribonuclease V alpha subunit
MQLTNSRRLNVFNGEAGIVTAIYRDLGPENGPGLTVDFGGDRKVRYSADEAAEQLDLAYAVTVHKAQGSEYPVVVIPLLMSQRVRCGFWSLFFTLYFFFFLN